MNGLEEFAVIVSLVTIACLALAFAIATWGFGPHTIRHFGHDMKFIPCRRCTAGTQWWTGSHWGPIPKHARTVQDGVHTFEPIQANVRKCPHCQLGGHWRDQGLQESRADEIEQGPGEFRS